VTLSGSDQVVNFTVQLVPSAPPVLTSLRVSGNTLSFTVEGEPGRQYRVYASTDLGTWSPVGTNTTSNPGGTFPFSDPLVAGARRFYRAVWVP
jgi:hypothetical protein